MMNKIAIVVLGLGLLLAAVPQAWALPAEGALLNAPPALVPQITQGANKGVAKGLDKSIQPGPDAVPVKYTIGNVPMIEQGRNECGPTVLSMVLNFYGAPVPISTLKSSLGWHPENGVSYQSMIRFPFKKYGLAVDYAGEGDWARLLFEVSRNRPVIVRQWANVAEKKLRQTGHYRIVVGYDRQSGKVYLHDPLFKTISLDKAEFLSLWDMKGHVNPTSNYMICLKKGPDGLTASSGAETH